MANLNEVIINSLQGIRRGPIISLGIFLINYFLSLKQKCVV